VHGSFWFDRDERKKGEGKERRLNFTKGVRLGPLTATLIVTRSIKMPSTKAYLRAVPILAIIACLSVLAFSLDSTDIDETLPTPSFINTLDKKPVRIHGELLFVLFTQSTGTKEESWLFQLWWLFFSQPSKTNIDGYPRLANTLGWMSIMAWILVRPPLPHSFTNLDFNHTLSCSGVRRTRMNWSHLIRTVEVDFWLELT